MNEPNDPLEGDLGVVLGVGPALPLDAPHDADEPDQWQLSLHRHPQATVLRRATLVAHAAHVLPTAPGLFDLLMQVPVMSIDRARRELGWSAASTAGEAVLSFLRADPAKDELKTPPLARATSGPLRVHELVTGLGERP